jgi:hypothetical protein
MTENQEDIICPNQGTHLASCTKCSEGFNIISELGKILNKKLEDLKTLYAVKYNTTSNKNAELSSAVLDTQLAKLDSL